MPRQGPHNKARGSALSVSEGGREDRLIGAPSSSTLVVSGPLPLPLYHHPVVALSLVLMVACLAQIAAWLVSTRLPFAAAQPPPNPAVYGYLSALLETRLGAMVPAQKVDSALFIAALSICVLSAAGWYGVARAGLGTRWGLWTALLWVVHPSFAFIAQRAGPLALVILLTPVSLGLLLWWRKRRRHRRALLAGAALGLLALTSLHGLLLAPILIVAILLAPFHRKVRARGALFLCVGFGLVMATATMVLRPPFQLSEAARHVDTCWRLSLESDHPELSATVSPEAAAVSPAEPCACLLLQYFRESPGESLRWLAGRLWRSVYATVTGTLQRPLFAMQMFFLVPAVWGCIVALRYRPWRWTAVVCCLFAAIFWLLAGLMGPLARNLTPVGGIPVILALIGVADVYERLFGRRLTSIRQPRTP